MPKRIKKQRPKDVNQLAHELVRLSTQAHEQALPTKAEISRVMAELGRRGGKESGKRRKENISPEKRAEIASLAAKARWKKHQAAKQQ